MKNCFLQKHVLSLWLFVLLASLVSAETEPRIFTREGKSADPAFFPIAVWLQDPRNAERFKAAGINLYVGLWQGPTAEQLTALEKAGMPVICDQNEAGLQNLHNPVIAAWMHGDEPDNAQPLPDGKGYGPPIPPARIVEEYERMRASDPSRPVLLNLGQGVAWDNWFGRGERTNHPEDYAGYAKGGDIISFDIYPAVHVSPEVAGKLEFVAKGVQRLKNWTQGRKPVWACIECSRIDNPNAKPTPDQIRAEVWMALIEGARGLIYFTHQFQPEFRDTAVLDDPELLPAITAINGQIRELAPILNSPDIDGEVKVEPEKGAIGIMVKQGGESLWIFAVNRGNTAVRATFSLPQALEGKKLEALGEAEAVGFREKSFVGDFAPYKVRLYRISPYAAKQQPRISPLDSSYNVNTYKELSKL